MTHLPRRAPVAPPTPAQTPAQRSDSDRDVFAAALLRYGQHDPQCPVSDPWRAVDDPRCTCGLAPLARRARAPRRFGP